jgi:DNA-binding NarL/FixJ family response regulator
VRRVRQHRPDVVLMDLRMPGVNGLDATAEIAADPRLAEVRVLVLTTFDDAGDVLAAVRAGAAGYLLKDADAEELRRAVRAVAAGHALLAPGVTRHVLDAVARRPAPDRDLTGLTERERAVLARVGLGETNAEIGRALLISPATARTYVSRLLTKLDARDRTQLAVIAHRAGLDQG